ncbi:hypothetical protein [Curtobacterium sp. L1-20]|uniref:hypothetical protein n=1 Tax=Curtobacterium sp. L1-20 TaxID=3138181 RepID=UPI003B52C0B9
MKPGSHGVTSLHWPSTTEGIRPTTIVDVDGVLIRRVRPEDVPDRPIRDRLNPMDGVERLEHVHASVIDVLSTGKVRWTAVAVVNDALAAGERVIVVTPSNSTFVRALLDTLGLNHASVSVVEPGEGLRRDESLAALLLDEPIDRSRARFYTTSAAPTLAAAGVRTVLVDPSPDSTARAAEMPGVSIVTWRNVEHPTVIARALGLSV